MILAFTLCEFLFLFWWKSYILYLGSSPLKSVFIFSPKFVSSMHSYKFLQVLTDYFFRNYAATTISVTMTTTWRIWQRWISEIPTPIILMTRLCSSKTPAPQRYIRITRTRILMRPMEMIQTRALMCSTIKIKDSRWRTHSRDRIKSLRAGCKN